MGVTLAHHSSVVRGGGGEGGGRAFAIGLKSTQNTLVLVLLRRIFALKTKIAPLMVLALRVAQKFDVILTTKTGFQPGWRRFSFFLLFGDRLLLDRKTVSIRFKLNYNEDLFFSGDHLNFDRNADSIWMQTNQNLGQVRFMLFPASTTAPPNANSWLRACHRRGLGLEPPAVGQLCSF